MRKIMLIGLMILSLPVFGKIKQATLVASGLTCSMCSKSIFKALEKVNSVKSIEADVEKSTFTILFKEGTAVSLDEVKGAVEDAGFSVASLLVVVSFSDEAIQNDTHVNIDGNTFHFVGVPKKVLNGDVPIKVIDKNYLAQKERKKYSKLTSKKCFETGEKAACCPENSAGTNRIYHATL